MDKAMNYLSLARKAGIAELGEEPVGGAARAGKAYLILVACDGSDHTWRRAKSFVAGTSQLCLRVPYTKNQLGMAIGRQELAIAAITDPAMALSLVKALPDAETYVDVVTALTEKVKRMKERQKEAKAHQKNVAKGKKK